MADTVRAIVAKAKARNCRLVLPIDGRVARRFEAGAPSEVVAIGQVPEDGMILDIGPASEEAIRGHSRPAARWSGTAARRVRDPALRCRDDRGRPPGRRADRAGKLMSVAGGGDTLSALAHAGVLDQLSYVSTAGGAFLEWLEGKELPGVAVLRKE